MKIVYCSGGLGNQMFQVALYLQLKEKEKEIFLDMSSFSEVDTHNGWEIEKIFKNIHNEVKVIEIEKKIKISIKIKKIIKKLIKFFSLDFLIRFLMKKKNNSLYERVKNKNFFYEENLFKLKKYYKITNIEKENIYFIIGEYKNEIFKNKKNMYILGCPQSEKYFFNIKEKIKYIYNFPEIFDEKNKKILNLIKKSNSISIHIRRGDYINEPGLGGMISKKYYIEAIEYIKEKIIDPVFYVFSNDINWCKENLKIDFPIYYIDWNKGKESFRDMQLMSLCKHNIIPNSTFSWWGAWLNSNPNKIVVAPERWFNPEVQQIDKDIIPINWIKIKNY